MRPKAAQFNSTDNLWLSVDAIAGHLLLVAAAPVPAIDVADLAASTASATAGVVGLDAGALGAFATYGAGRRCRGVSVNRGADGTKIVIRVTAAYGTQLPELGLSVRRAVEEAVRALDPPAPLVVDVEITDLVAPEEPLP